MFAGQSLKIVSVHVSGNRGRGIAVSEAVKFTKTNADGLDSGVVVFELTRVGDQWQLNDVDFESDERAAQKLKKFQDEFADATEIPGKSDPPALGSAPGPVYETGEEIKLMAPCKATVVQRGPCFVYLRAADGKGFYLGSPASKADVSRFLGILKDGQIYTFPDAFLEYQEQQRKEP